MKKAAAKKAPAKRVVQVEDLLASVESAKAPAAPAKPKSIEITIDTGREKQGKQNRLRLIFLAIFAIILAVVAIATTKQNKVTAPTPTPSPSASASQSAKPAAIHKASTKKQATNTKKTAAKKSVATPKPSASTAKKVAKTLHSSVSARMTADGATVLWTAPATSGISGYKIEVAVDGSNYRLLSTVSSDTTSIDLTKSSDAGVTMVRISAMLANGSVVSLGEFGLPGKY